MLALPKVVAVKSAFKKEVPSGRWSPPPVALWIRLAMDRVKAYRKTVCISLHLGGQGGSAAPCARSREERRAGLPPRACAPAHVAVHSGSKDLEAVDVAAERQQPAILVARAGGPASRERAPGRTWPQCDAVPRAGSARPPSSRRPASSYCNHRSSLADGATTYYTGAPKATRKGIYSRKASPKRTLGGEKLGKDNAERGIIPKVAAYATVVSHEEGGKTGES
eukprot:scaffold7549_cov111-Isochrysis_galbana.AAC.4